MFSINGNNQYNHVLIWWLDQGQNEHHKNHMYDHPVHPHEPIHPSIMHACEGRLVAYKGEKVPQLTKQMMSGQVAIVPWFYLRMLIILPLIALLHHSWSLLMGNELIIPIWI
jgi:hypothetical protein